MPTLISVFFGGCVCVCFVVVGFCFFRQQFSNQGSKTWLFVQTHSLPLLRELCHWARERAELLPWVGEVPAGRRECLNGPEKEGPNPSVPRESWSSLVLGFFSCIWVRLPSQWRSSGSGQVSVWKMAGKINACSKVWYVLQILNQQALCTSALPLAMVCRKRTVRTIILCPGHFVPVPLEMCIGVRSNMQKRDFGVKGDQDVWNVSV